MKVTGIMTMNYSSSSSSKHGQAYSVCPAAADFLRDDGKMAGVLPTAARLIALQKSCKQNLPQLFGTCEVLRLEDGLLTVSAPNAAAASRLKQTLPLLQEKLSASGWQINAIRVKVQVGRMPERPPAVLQKPLPPQALSALAALNDQLAPSGNENLKKALCDMLGRHKPAHSVSEK